MRIRTSAAFAITSAFLLPVIALAATGDTLSSSSSSASTESESSAVSITPGFGTVTVEQNSPKGTVGTWTLLGTDGHETQGGGLSTKVEHLPAGRFTLFVTAPNGASTAVRVYEGSTQIVYQPYPQASFILQGNGELKITVNYQYTKLGNISVTSDPGGVEFTITGPNDIVLEGVTPKSFESQPEGQYKVQFRPPSGCGNPPPKGDVLLPNGRVSFSMTLACKAADALRDRQNDDGSSGNFVTVKHSGQDVTLRDVPSEAWFALFVASVTKVGIMSGYRDDQGNPSGQFGPGNPVTIAELAKIAHNIGGLTESGLRSSNPLAQEGWFTGVMGSAEERGWRLYSDATIDPLRPATRSEVLVTLLQALDVPVRWQKGNVFADVTVKTPFAAIIETAANEGLVSGKDDGTGRKLFSPDEAINRAELAKILTAAHQKYRSKTASE